MREDQPAIVCTLYINATPVRLFEALVNPEVTSRYWGHTLATDWKVGSEMAWGLPGGAGMIIDPGQVVLEYDPPRRVAYTWHTFTAAWAEASGQSEEFRAKAAAEPRSKVSFEVEPAGSIAKLTVVHYGFADETSVVLASCRVGWPYLVSDLKTLLETGAVMPRG